MPNTATPTGSQISQSWDSSHLCWAGGTNSGFAKTCGPASMGHFTGAQLPFYYSLASQFPIGDRYFCSVMAQTYPNRRFLIAATALGDVSTNATGISSTDAPNGTIFDRLNSYDITWRDYFPDLPTAALFLPEYTANLSDGKLAPINQFLSRRGCGPASAVLARRPVHQLLRGGRRHFHRGGLCRPDHQCRPGFSQLVPHRDVPRL